MLGEKEEKMPIKGEQQGYTYKALINGEWQEVTIQESPLELVERFEQDEEWTRVRHGHWIGASQTKYEKMFYPQRTFKCSVCGNYLDFDGVNAGRGSANFCPNCGAKMDEVE